MKPFKALISHTDDTSTETDITFKAAMLARETGTVVKGAEFTLKSSGECPWPPQSILGRHVVVMDADEYRRLTGGR